MRCAIWIDERWQIWILARVASSQYRRYETVWAVSQNYSCCWLYQAVRSISLFFKNRTYANKNSVTPNGQWRITFCLMRSNAVGQFSLENNKRLFVTRFYDCSNSNWTKNISNSNWLKKKNTFSHSFLGVQIEKEIVNKPMELNLRVNLKPKQLKFEPKTKTMCTFAIVLN